MSKLEKIFAGIVTIATLIWLVADRHHSHVELDAVTAEMAEIARGLGTDAPAFETRAQTLMTRLQGTERRWIGDEIDALEVQLNRAWASHRADHGPPIAPEPSGPPTPGLAR